MAINQAALDACRSLLTECSLLKQPRMTPDDDGGMVLIWRKRKRQLDIQIGAAGFVEYFVHEDDDMETGFIEPHEFPGFAAALAAWLIGKPFQISALN